MRKRLARIAYRFLRREIDALVQREDEFVRLQRELMENQREIIHILQRQGPDLTRAVAALGRSFPSFKGLGGIGRT